MTVLPSSCRSDDIGSRDELCAGGVLLCVAIRDEGGRQPTGLHAHECGPVGKAGCICHARAKTTGEKGKVRVFWFYWTQQKGAREVTDTGGTGRELLIGGRVALFDLGQVIRRPWFDYRGGCHCGIKAHWRASCTRSGRGLSGGVSVLM